jgi:hypothetical protein
MPRLGSLFWLSKLLSHARTYLPNNSEVVANSRKGGDGDGEIQSEVLCRRL